MSAATTTTAATDGGMESGPHPSLSGALPRARSARVAPFSYAGSITVISYARLRLSIADVRRFDWATAVFDEAQALADKAHQVCPYSNATRGNIRVDVSVVED